MGETIPADHHEPAEGDEVHVAPISKDRARVLFDAAVRAAYDDGANAAKRGMQTAACSALRSIASALGMSADALPGAIVERVEQFARAAEQLDALRTAHVDGWRDIRAALGARDGEQTVDAAIRVRRERDEAEAALMTAQAERDSLGEVIAQTRTALGAGDAEVERLRASQDEARDLTALLAAADHVDATARAAEGAGPAEREAAREARHELRRVVAELRAGVPAGVLVSREDAAVVTAVLRWAEKYERGDNGSPEMLDGATRAWIEAGRPLASKEGA